MMPQITSPSSVAFARNTPVRPRFAGEAEYREYLATLQAFEPDSLERLANIKRNEKNEGFRHIALAVWHGFRDPAIDALNKVIRGLITARNRHREQDPAASALASEHLGDLRRAIEDTLVAQGFDKTGHRIDQTG